jgi:hypothetical protein
VIHLAIVWIGLAIGVVGSVMMWRMALRDRARRLAPAYLVGISKVGVIANLCRSCGQPMTLVTGALVGVWSDGRLSHVGGCTP